MKRRSPSSSCNHTSPNDNDAPSPSPSCSYCLNFSFSSFSTPAKSQSKSPILRSRIKQRMNVPAVSSILLFISSTLFTTDALTTSWSLRQSHIAATTATSTTTATTTFVSPYLQKQTLSKKPQHVQLYMTEENNTISSSSTSSSSSNSSSSKKQQRCEKNKQRQMNLFQTVAKYNNIQNQLSSLNLDIATSSTNIRTNINTRSSSAKSNNLHNLTDMDFVLEQQAQALQISKSTLTYLQLKGQKAREKILLSNMGLVHFAVNKVLSKWKNKNNNHMKSNKSSSSSSSANKSTNANIKKTSKRGGITSNLNKEDLIQEGMIGLTYAIDKFDLSKNVNFSTYAMYWIEGRIMRYTKMKSNFIHIPEYMQLIISKLERKVYEMEVLYNDEEYDVMAVNGSNDRFRKLEEMILADESKMNFLCQELSLDSTTIKKAFQVRRTMYNAKSNSMVELEDYMMKNSKTLTDSNTSTSTIASTNEMSSSDPQQQQLILERYQSILTQFISMREMEALSWRYGLREQTTEPSQEVPLTLQNKQRDYEAEAEADLFGPSGILSISSISVNPSGASINTANTGTAQKASSRSKIWNTNTIPNKTSTITSIHTSAFTSSKQQSTTTTKISRNKGSSSSGNTGGRWGEAMSFNEVGAQMRVSAEYGRRLCASALKKLTKAAEEGHLDPAMLF